jgi:hypothetical protein
MPSKKATMDYRKKNPHQVRMSPEEYQVWKEFKNDKNERESLLKEEATQAGIDLKDIKHYWYKSEKFSMFAKNDVKSLDEIKAEILDEIKSLAPKFPKIKRKASEDDHLLFIGLADLHLGKLSSAFETGDPYNHMIAEDRAKEGIIGLLDKSSGFNIDKIVFNMGNDVLHVDTPKNTTTSGTQQDASLMWYDAFRMAFKLMVELIEICSSVADVHVIYDPSNHDYMSGFMLAQGVEAWFRKSKNVTFDVSIAHRKYYKYGKNLIGTTHGDGAKADKLPQLMSIEAKEHWVDCDHYYIYTKHLHHKVSKDYMNVNVETLRSPSGTDSWHHRNGFQHAPKAVEGFLHHKLFGRIASLTHLF